MKTKELEKIKKILESYLRAEKALKHESHGNINCSGNSPQRPGKKIGELEITGRMATM